MEVIVALEIIKGLAQLAATASQAAKLSKDEAKTRFLADFDGFMAQTASPLDPVKP